VNPADNAGRFFAALRAAKVPAELHVYSSGGHGFGIIKSWQNLSGVAERASGVAQGSPVGLTESRRFLVHYGEPRY
jgi:acetyl esterase/lipase